MLLLFVGGVMNLLWVALIAAFILAEKTVPRGEWLSYGAGVGSKQQQTHAHYHHGMGLPF